MKRITSLLLVMLFLLNLVPTAFAVESPTTQAPDKIDASTVWSYLDDNTDPAGDPEDTDYVDAEKQTVVEDEEDA